MMTGNGRVVTDLSLLVAFVVGATVVLLVPGVPWQVEWLVAVPLVLVVPGYAVVAALFPAGPTDPRTDSRHLGSPGWAVRIALMLVLSAVVVAVIGVLLALAGWLLLVPVVLALAGITAVGAVVAHVRRRNIAVERRSNPGALFRFGSLPARLNLSKLQTVAFVAGTLMLVGAVAGTAASPTQGASFSEASLLAGGDTDDLLGANSTVTLVDGEANAVHLRLQNHEGRQTTYRLVGQLQRVASDGTVLESVTVDEGQVPVAAGDTAVVARQIDPSMTGDSLRLQYLVYTDAVPADPAPGNADLALRHWVEAVEGGTE